MVYIEIHNVQEEIDKSLFKKDIIETTSSTKIIMKAKKGADKFTRMKTYLSITGLVELIQWSSPMQREQFIVVLLTRSTRAFALLNSNNSLNIGKYVITF